MPDSGDLLAMRYEDYRQLRTYSRYDGVYLAILWAASFALTIIGDPGSPLPAAGSLIVLASPLFVAYRLGKFRDVGLGGYISFGRAALYSVRVFAGGGLWFALAQWAYMRFLDGGRLASLYRATLEAPETQAVLRLYGMTEAQVEQVAEQASSPVAVASQSFVMAVLAGAVLGVAIAAVMRRAPRQGGRPQES